MRSIVHSVLTNTPLVAGAVLMLGLLLFEGDGLIGVIIAIAAMFSVYIHLVLIKLDCIIDSNNTHQG